MEQRELIGGTIQYALRSNDNSRTSWALTSLAIRIAHSLGLHRDGNGSHMAPFAAQMRRRVWWQLNVLDIRGSEDRGTEPMILEGTSNTEKPLHINDQDMDPQSNQELVERTGWSDMTLSLITYECSNLAKRLNCSSPTGEQMSIADLKEKERLVAECQRRVEEKYLKYSDGHNSPISRVTAVITRLIMSKLQVTLHYPLGRQVRTSDASGVTRNQLFQSAVELLEYALILDTSEEAKRCIWATKT